VEGLAKESVVVEKGGCLRYGDLRSWCGSIENTSAEAARH